MYKRQVDDRLRSPLTGLAPEAKVVGLVVFLVVVAITPPSAPWILAADAGIAIAVAVIALVDWRAVAARLTLDVPLLALAVTYALAGRGPHVDIGGLRVSQPGVRVGVAILAKATIGIIAVSALAASTTVPETIDGLRRVGAPAWFRQMVALTARQLQVLRADLARARLAVEVRTGSTRRSLAVTTATRSLGSLFVRTAERADRLQLAAELRGASGAAGPATGTSTPPATVRAWSICLLPALVAVAVAVVLR